MSSPVAALPARIPIRGLVPFLLAGVGLAGAYGTSFLLADHLRELGYRPSMAGAVVSVGIVATITCALVAGRVAERIGLMLTITLAALALAAAMLCFALIGTFEPLAYLGGLLMGVGWSVFYILAPVQVIHHLRPEARIKYLTLLSGSQMLGLGSAPLIGRAVEAQFGSFDAAYFGFVAICVVSAALLLATQRALRDEPRLPMTAMALTREAASRVLRARTALPVAMIGLAACVFAGLSTFQSLYAESRGLSPETFFLVFTVTTVALRFSVAPLIGRIALEKLVLALFLATMTAVVLLRVNDHSLPLYAVATVIFATGYGLTYSALNSMVVNIAGERGLSISVTSQVFTLAYFVGLFGFPYIGGVVIASSGVNAVLWVMVTIVLLNVCLVVPLLRERPRAEAARLDPRPTRGSEAA